MVSMLYIPLVFIHYNQKQYDNMHNAVQVFLSQPNRAIVSVIGNADNVEADQHPLPCITKDVICVGGLEKNGTVWKDGANIEKYIDVYAPASGIIAGLDKNSNRLEDNGVSASGAIVAGMISNVILEKDFKSQVEKIKNGSKFILNKDGSIDEDKKGVSY